MTLGASDPFLYFHPDDNVAPDATWSVQTGTEDSAYPATNAPVVTPDLIASPAKLEETSGAWLGDFGSAQRMDLMVLQGNFDAGATVRCQLNAANSWAGPTVNALFTIPAARADGYRRKVWIDLRSASGYSAAGFRYVRIVATTASSNPIGIKVWLFETVRQLSRDFQWNVETGEQHVGIVMKTDAGVRWGYDLASAPRTLVGQALLEDSDAEAVREWFRACAGIVTPTVIIPEPTVNDAYVVFWSPNGFSIESPNIVVAKQANTRQYTDVNLTRLAFEEVAIGDPEWF